MIKKGFSAVEVLILLVIIGLIAGVGWYVWQSKYKNSYSSQKTNSDSAQTTTKPDASSTALAIAALGIKVNDPENRNLQLHSEKICAAECDTQDSYFIRDKNDIYFNRCDYPAGLSKISESSFNNDAKTPESYAAKHSKKIGNNYYYVFPGSHFQSACDKLQNGDKQYEDGIRQYILDNIEKL